jgi:hypothetical protein
MKKQFATYWLFLSFLLVGTSLSAQTNAKVNGTWLLNVESPMGSGTPSFSLKQSTDSTFEGTYQGQLGETNVKGTVKGNKIHISFSISDNLIEYDGTVDGDTMKGKVVLGTLGEGTFTGNRKNS